MQKDIKRLLIETKIRNSLNNTEASPERSIRNLIDLGLSLSKGRFQNAFLGAAHNMLQNGGSAYYELFKDALINVDRESLITFGVNLGYNSCTAGAKQIRRIEAERRFNVPWSLSLQIDGEKAEENAAKYMSITVQGTKLGIYTYFLFVSGNPLKILPVIAENDDCAFVLFVRGRYVAAPVISRLKALKNVMLAVYADEKYFETCALLRAEKLMYSVWLEYKDDDYRSILCGDWLNDAVKAHPLFACLVAHPSCSGATAEKVYGYALATRQNQKYPALVTELKRDSLAVDKVISDDFCSAAFGADGALMTNERNNDGKVYNIFESSLEQILSSAFYK